MSPLPAPPPIQGLLVPPGPRALPADFLPVRQTLLRGLPDSIQLDADLTVVVVVPNGLARTWSKADPEDLVSRAEPQRTPWDPKLDGPVGAVRRFPARLVVQERGAVLGILPLVAALRRIVPRDGAAEQGSRVELVVLDWEIRAGTLRGPGDFGSAIELAWRRAERASATFRAPAVNPHVAARLGPRFRLESSVG